MSSLAAASSSSSQGSSFGGVLFFLLPVLLLVFLFWTQRRRQKQFQQAQQGLRPGMDVSTTSGLRGRLVSIDDQVAEIEAAQGVVLRFDRRAVAPLPPAAPQTAPTDAGTTDGTATDKDA